MSPTIFDLSARDIRGEEIQFRDFAGKVLLVVNTASKCGFTPQYEGLERLYQTYKDQGLVVIGFPCDQFAHQEPGTNDEIAQFCQVRFGVTFPITSKVEVNGPGTHPVFQFVKERAPGFLGQRVKWNFTKFLVQRDGRTVRRFPPHKKPKNMEQEIEQALRT